MPRTCSVLQCSSRNESGKSLFAAPKNPRYRPKWIEFMTSNGQSLDSTTNFLVCEDHFAQEVLQQGSRGKVIQRGTFPTIWIPEPGTSRNVQSRKVVRKGSSQKMEVERTSCSVIGCDNTIGTSILHKPPEDRETRVKWRRYLKLNGTDSIERGFVICSDHFTFSHGKILNYPSEPRQNWIHNRKMTHDTNAKRQMVEAIDNESRRIICQCCLKASKRFTDIGKGLKEMFTLLFFEFELNNGIICSTCYDGLVSTRKFYLSTKNSQEEYFKKVMEKGDEEAKSKPTQEKEVETVKSQPKEILPVEPASSFNFSEVNIKQEPLDTEDYDQLQENLPGESSTNFTEMMIKDEPLDKFVIEEQKFEEFSTPVTIKTEPADDHLSEEKFESFPKSTSNVQKSTRNFAENPEIEIPDNFRKIPVHKISDAQGGTSKSQMPEKALKTSLKLTTLKTGASISKLRNTNQKVLKLSAKEFNEAVQSQQIQIIKIPPKAAQTAAENQRIPVQKPIFIKVLAKKSPEQVQVENPKIVKDHSLNSLRLQKSQETVKNEKIGSSRVSRSSKRKLEESKLNSQLKKQETSSVDEPRSSKMWSNKSK